MNKKSFKWLMRYLIMNILAYSILGVLYMLKILPQTSVVGIVTPSSLASITFFIFLKFRKRNILNISLFYQKYPYSLSDWKPQEEKEILQKIISELPNENKLVYVNSNYPFWYQYKYFDIIKTNETKAIKFHFIVKFFKNNGDEILKIFYVILDQRDILDYGCYYEDIQDVLSEKIADHIRVNNERNKL